MSVSAPAKKLRTVKTVTPEQLASYHEPPEPTQSTNVYDFMRLLHPDGVFELRIPETPRRKGDDFKATASGYFDDHLDAAKEVVYWSKRQPPGICCTLNPTKPALLARALNRVEFRPKATTSDQDITCRRWLFIDIDPIRDSGMSATEAESLAASRTANDINNWLATRGWPDPIHCMSGNGAYLLYRVELPNDEPAKELLASFLKVLASRFSNDAAEVDEGVFKASQLLKVCGTWARKGDNLVRGTDDDRPHRRSHFTAPNEIKVVDRSLIESVVTEFAIAETARPAATVATSVSSSSVIERCRSYLASMPPAVAGQGGHNKTLEAGATIERFGLSEHDGWLLMREYNARCQPPWDERDLERKLTEGMRKAREAGETGKLLEGNRQATMPTPAVPAPAVPIAYRVVEPGTRVEAGDRGNVGEVMSDDGDSCTVRFTSKEGNTATKSLPKSELKVGGQPLSDAPATEVQNLIVSAADLITEFPALREPIIRGICRRGETVNLIGAPKVGKSWAILSLLLSVASGRPWLNTFATKPGPVLLIDNELHRETLSERLLIVATTMGIPDSVVRENVDVLSLRGQLVDIDGIRDLLKGKRDRGYLVAALDAFYRSLPAGTNENDNAQMASVYNTIDNIADSLNCGFVLNHHSSKGDQSGKGVTDVGSGAGSISRAADTHLIIRPHKEDGHAVLDGVCRSFRAFDPMTLEWDFPMWRASDMEPEVRLPKSRQQANKESNDNEDEARIIQLLNETGELSTKAIREELNCGNERANRLLRRLEKTNQLASERKKSTANGHQGTFWRLSPTIETTR